MLKKYFTKNFIHLIYMSDSIYLYQPVALSPSAQPSSSYSLLTFPLSSLPFYNISVPSTALDIQNSLKPFTVTSGEIHCHAITIHID
jgi:hypothetical protein